MLRNRTLKNFSKVCMYTVVKIICKGTKFPPLDILYLQQVNISISIADEAPEEGPYEENNQLGDALAAETTGANLELGAGGGAGSGVNEGEVPKEIKPKRKLAVQPLLDSNRVMGKKGVRILPKVFEDFEPKGG